MKFGGMIVNEPTNNALNFDENVESLEIRIM